MTGAMPGRVSRWRWGPAVVSKGAVPVTGSVELLGNAGTGIWEPQGIGMTGAVGGNV